MTPNRPTSPHPTRRASPAISPLATRLQRRSPPRLSAWRHPPFVPPSDGRMQALPAACRRGWAGRASNLVCSQPSAPRAAVRRDRPPGRAGRHGPHTHHSARRQLVAQCSVAGSVPHTHACLAGPPRAPDNGFPWPTPELVKIIIITHL